MKVVYMENILFRHFILFYFILFYFILFYFIFSIAAFLVVLDKNYYFSLGEILKICTK